MRLGVLLLNPTPSGKITRHRIAIVEEALQVDEMLIANLIAKESRGISALNLDRIDDHFWEMSRAAISSVIWQSDILLIGWGVSRLKGCDQLRKQSQQDWAFAEARRAGHLGYWTVGGTTMHPSRWHRRGVVGASYDKTEPVSRRITRALKFVFLAGG